MEPPKGLRTKGQRLWRETIAGVVEGWRLDIKDTTLLEQAARLADTIARLQRRVDREGILVSGSEGQTPGEVKPGRQRRCRRPEPPRPSNRPWG